MVSRTLKCAAATVAALSFASAASAGCGSSVYCGQTSGHSTLPALSSWSGHTGASYAMNGTSSRYSPSTSYTTTMSAIEADHSYGTGSISESYSSSYDTQSFYGSTSSLAGLGHNESLRATSCPTTVYGTTSSASVLGCYNVVKPVARTSYYRVVRPVIYVRYPVPVAVPYVSPCAANVHYSRYGGFGPQGGYGGYTRGHCG